MFYIAYCRGRRVFGTCHILLVLFIDSSPWTTILSPHNCECFWGRWGGRGVDSGDFDYIFHIHLGTSSPLLYGPKNDKKRNKNVKKNI